MALTIHHALMELKTLDKRITRALGNKFVGYRVGDLGVVQNYKSNEDFIKEAKASIDSVQGLINRRNEIKKKLIASNAVTEITVAGVTMTVAEAIDRKDAISYDKQLYNTLRNQYNTVQRDLLNAEVVMNQKIDARSNEMGANGSKVNSSELQEIERMVERRYKPAIIDPIEIVKQMDTLIESIEKFEAEVDAALSVSNAKTMIDVE